VSFAIAAAICIGWLTWWRQV